MADFHEETIAGWFGAKRTPRSGAGRVKGDNTTDTVMFECKATKSPAARVTAGLLESIYREATQSGRMPILSVMGVSGDPFQRSTLLIEWVYFLWPWEHLTATDAVTSLRLDKTSHMPSEVTFKTRPGYPQVWRIGCKDHLSREMSAFSPSTTSSRKKGRRT